MQDLEYYKNLFANLHTAVLSNRQAPHKAILLLSVIDLVEAGIINSPSIPLTDMLVNRFKASWKKYLGALQLFKPDICKPFFHMQHEPFWCLHDNMNDLFQKLADSQSTVTGAEKKELPKGGYSLKALRQAFCCAEIDSALFYLMQDQEARGRLRVVLISNYLTDQRIGLKIIKRLSLVSILAYLLVS